MQSSLPMHQAKRCRARSKRSGKRCQLPAVRNFDVCRMHGARGGPPKGNKNALRHGRNTAEAIRARRYFSMLARIARQTVREIG